MKTFRRAIVAEEKERNEIVFGETGVIRLHEERLISNGVLLDRQLRNQQVILQGVRGNVRRHDEGKDDDDDQCQDDPAGGVVLAVGRWPLAVVSANGERRTANEIDREVNERDQSDAKNRNESDRQNGVRQRKEERRRADDAGAEGGGGGDVVAARHAAEAEACRNEHGSEAKRLQAHQRVTQRRVEGDESNERRGDRQEPKKGGSASRLVMHHCVDA